MVKEIALLPEVPKCLTNFDPTKFRPDWKASGRRWRVDKAAKCLDEVGEALYSKGVVRMSLMAAVDDSRKVCHIVVIIDVVIVIIVVSSVRSSNSHPDLLLTQHHHQPLFQITPVLNTGLSLSEPLQLFKGYYAI